MDPSLTPWPRGVLAGFFAAVTVTACTENTGQVGRSALTSEPARQLSAALVDDATGPAAPVAGAKSGGTITVLQAADFEHLDPAQNYVNVQQIVALLFLRGLTVPADVLTNGVIGRTRSPRGRGVWGHATATTGQNYGVVGGTNSPEGYAGWFQGGRNYFGGNVGIFVAGSRYPLHVQAFDQHIAVLGETDYTLGSGLAGYANAISGSNKGVFGLTYSTSGYGVYGYATAPSGTNRGVYGKTDSPDGYAGYFEGGRNYRRTRSRGRLRCMA